jgi:hypothetical protein
MAIVSYSEEELDRMEGLTDWEYLKNMKDEDIVYDEDNPEWTDEDFARATRQGKPIKFLPPKKVMLYLQPSLVEELRRSDKNWRKRLSASFETWLRQNRGVAAL